MRQKRGDEWYPFWVDKWLFGSTRIEFSPAQRAVWIDLLTLSKKDEGFIRANEGAPYPIEQLAGLFRVKPALLLATITKAIEVKKLEKLPDGTLYVVSTPDYQLSKRHKRRLALRTEKDTMSAQPDTMSENEDAKNRIEESREEEKRRDKEKNTEKKRVSPFVEEFEKEFWENVPNKLGKGKAREAYIKARKKVSKEEILAGLPKYKAYEESRKNQQGDYRPLHPTTWLNEERWEDEVDLTRSKDNERTPKNRRNTGFDYGKDPDSIEIRA